VPVAESDEGRRGAVLDYDSDGNLVAIELIDASQVLDDPASSAVG
jgi:YD repeat-containing protein